MIYTKKTKRAICLAYEAHAGQVDKSGLPYIHHPLHVAESMTDETSTIVALLHDCVEDTNLTFDDIEREGFGAEVVEALRLLTHQKGVPYMDYIRAIKPNPIAREVKVADLLHNMDTSRLDTMSEKDVERVKKYQKALDYLLAMPKE